MGKKIILMSIFLFLVLVILDDLNKKINRKPEYPQKLYFEFRKKESTVTADGFIKYKGKWLPIVLNDSVAEIYE